MGKKAKLKALKKAMREHIAVGFTPINALHATYMYGTDRGFQLDHRTLRRLMPTDTTVRVTRVRKNPSGTHTRYGTLVVQRGSLAHEASIAHPEHGWLLIDGAIAQLRRANDNSIEEVADVDLEELSEDDIDTDIDIDPVPVEAVTP